MWPPQDHELGELEEGEAGDAAAGARGHAELSHFSSVLDEFLQEKVRAVRSTAYHLRNCRATSWGAWVGGR